MTRVRSTVVGSWLLERAGIEAALAGDLAEHTADGASTLWYWRQVMLSILAVWIGTIRAHKWLAVRAVVTGWVREHREGAEELRRAAATLLAGARPCATC